MAIKIGQYMNVTGVPRPGSQPVPVNPPPVTPEVKKEEIQPAPTLSKPQAVPLQPAPILSEPTSPPLQPAPVLSTPTAPPIQAAPQLGTPMAVQTEVTQKAPEVTPRQPVPFQEAPPLPTPQPVAFQPPPELSSPAPIPPIEPAPQLSAPTAPPTQPAPPLPTPAVIPFEPAPELSKPAVIPFEPAPPLPTPAVIPFEPAPPLPTPAVIPFEPAPPLTTPAVIPFEPAPPLTTPQPIPFQAAPPPTLPTPVPFQEAPPLSVPASIPEEPPPPLQQPHPPRFANDIPYSDGLLDVHPGAQSDQIGEQVKWSDRVDTQGGNLDLLTSNVPAPFIGSFGFASLNPETLPNNLKLAAISEAQILAGRMGVQSFIDNAKDIATIATKQQSTLIGMGMDLLNNAVFGSARGQSYHPVDGPTDQPQQPLDVDKLQSDNRYRPDLTDAIAGPTLLSTNDTSAPNNTPEAMDLRYLNNPDTADPETKKDRLQSMWIPPKADLTNKPDPQVVTSNISNDNIKLAFTDPDMKFWTSTSAEETRGFFDVDASNNTSRENSLPTDDDAYMPLVFTDLRALQGKHYRSVYFRPFIKSLSEELSPQWNMQNFFGRVDPVATYQNTNRTINLAFKVVAFSPEDLMTMYQKLGWLNSMVYPQYRNSVYFAGPVIRMRVGDIINAVGKEGNRGVPGVITNLNFNYDQSTWELLKGRRVPREVDVSLGFHVLHEYPIGLYHNLADDESDLSFGGIRAGGDKKNSEKTSYINIDRFRAIFGKDYLNDQRLQNENSAAPADLNIER